MAKRRTKRDRPTLKETKELRAIRDKQQVEIYALRGTLAKVESLQGDAAATGNSLRETAIVLRGLLFQSLSEIPKPSVLTNTIRRTLGLVGFVNITTQTQELLAAEREANELLAVAS